MSDPVRAAFVEWLNTETGLKVIESHQNRPGPSERYISINFKMYSGRSGGSLEDERISAGDDGTDALTTVVHRRESMASIQAHGQGAMEALEDARDALELVSKRKKYFGDRNLSADCETVRNIPEKKNEQWQPRANLDVVYRAVKTSIDRAPLLESAETSICADSDMQTITIEGDIP